MTRTPSLLASGLAALGLCLLGSLPSAAQTPGPSPTGAPTAAAPAPSPSASNAPATPAPSDQATPAQADQAAPAAVPSPSAAPQPAAPDAGPSPDADVRDQEHTESGGANNIVQVQNTTDGRFRMRGSVDLDHIQGDSATPTNEAVAYSSCADCQTFAVALQIALIPTDASTIAPVNQAVAVNDQCDSCYTSARALQYVFQVDDPQQLPDRARQLVNQMNRELRDIARTPDMTPTQANDRIDAVVAQFTDLAGNLKDQRQDADQPNQDHDSGPT